MLENGNELIVCRVVLFCFGLIVTFVTRRQMPRVCCVGGMPMDGWLLELAGPIPNTVECKSQDLKVRRSWLLPKCSRYSTKPATSASVPTRITIRRHPRH